MPTKLCKWRDLVHRTTGYTQLLATKRKQSSWSSNIQTMYDAIQPEHNHDYLE